MKAPLQIIHGLERKLIKAELRLSELQELARQIPQQQEYIREIQETLELLSSLEEP